MLAHFVAKSKKKYTTGIWFHDFVPSFIQKRNRELLIKKKERQEYKSHDRSIIILSATRERLIANYLDHTEATDDGIFRRIQEMILREHFLTEDLRAARLDGVRAGHYDYVIHEIPDVLERWNTPIRRDNVILVQYHSGTYVSAVLPDRRHVRMRGDINVAVILRYLSTDT